MPEEAVAPLEGLGERIVIMGPSNSGKSTLAHAIAARRALTVVHLDQLRFHAGSNWVMRSDADFAADHDAAIAGERWVMEGNYSNLMPQRLARATGIILLASGRWGNLYRYVRRSLFERGRIGSISGGRDSIKWQMVRWIVVVQPHGQSEYLRLATQSGLPFVHATSPRQRDGLYAAWGLERP